MTRCDNQITMDVDRLQERIELWRQTNPLSIFENDKELTDEEYRLAIYAIFAKYRRSKAREIVKVTNARVLAYIKSPRTSDDTNSSATSVKTNAISMIPCPPRVPKPVDKTNCRRNAHLIAATKLPIFNQGCVPLPPIATNTKKISAVMDHTNNSKKRSLLPVPIIKNISMMERYKAHLAQNPQISHITASAQRSLLPVLVKTKISLMEHYKTNLAKKAQGSKIPISQNMMMIKTSKQDALKSEKQKCDFIKKKIADCIAQKRKDTYFYFEIPMHDSNGQRKRDNLRSFSSTASKSASDSGRHVSRIPVKCQQKSVESKSVFKLPGINEHKVRRCGNY